MILIIQSNIVSRVKDFKLISERVKALGLHSFTASAIKPTESERVAGCSWYGNKHKVNLANGSTLMSYVYENAIKVVGKKEIELYTQTREDYRNGRNVVIKETIMSEVNIYELVLSVESYAIQLQSMLVDNVRNSVRKGLE